jgi:Cytochrome P450
LEHDVIMSNLITMLIGGEDTTAFTLAWAIHELRDSPRWRSELRSEADAVLGDLYVVPDVDAANRLPRANAVANEALRLRPAAPISIMNAIVDTMLGDYALPKGTGVAVLSRPAALEPERISPIRWLSARNAGLMERAARMRSRPTSRLARARGCAPAVRSRSSSAPSLSGRSRSRIGPHEHSLPRS